MIWFAWIASSPGKKLSNDDWQSRSDPDARIPKMKDGRTRLACKPEHAVDLDTGAIVAAPIHSADWGANKTLPGTLEVANANLEAVGQAPSQSEPSELVADRGHHSRDRLKDVDDSAGKAGSTSPSRMAFYAGRAMMKRSGPIATSARVFRCRASGLQAARRAERTWLRACPGSWWYAPGLAARP